MMLETALVAWLDDLAPNLYPLAAPLDYATPAVVYSRVSTQDEMDLDGGNDMGWIVMQLDVYDPSYLTAKELAHDIRDRLLSWDDDVVHAVTYTNETDIIDETTDTSLYRVMMTFLLFATL